MEIGWTLGVSEMGTHVSGAKGKTGGSGTLFDLLFSLLGTGDQTDAGEKGEAFSPFSPTALPHVEGKIGGKEGYETDDLLSQALHLLLERGGDRSSDEVLPLISHDIAHDITLRNMPEVALEGGTKPPAPSSVLATPLTPSVFSSTLEMHEVVELEKTSFSFSVEDSGGKEETALQKTTDLLEMKKIRAYTYLLQEMKLVGKQEAPIPVPVAEPLFSPEVGKVEGSEKPSFQALKELVKQQVTERAGIVMHTPTEMKMEITTKAFGSLTITFERGEGQGVDITVEGEDISFKAKELTELMEEAKGELKEKGIEIEFELQESTEGEEEQEDEEEKRKEERDGWENKEDVEEEKEDGFLRQLYEVIGGR